MASLLSNPDTDDVKSDSSRTVTEIPTTLNCKKTKLIVHLDLNNTILLCDTITGQGPSNALNSFLTTVTWGRKNQIGRWEWLSSVPSLNPPCDGAVSYYSQFGRVLDFTETDDGRHFKKIHSDCLQKLEWQNPYDELLSTTGEDGKHYHWILPAFFELIDVLLSQNREFAIIFRTFGTDLPRTLETIQFALSGNHPEYKHLQMKQLPISRVEGRIRCSADDVVLTVGSDRISLNSDSRGLYNYFSSLKGISGFQDHFDWWACNNFSNRGGKPLWIDPSHTGIHHIFIDDNIRLNDSDSIVYPQVFVKDGVRTVPTAELYDICLVQTNLLRAICDQNYFIKCVQSCEEKFSKYTTHCIAEDAVTTSDKLTTS